jgi:hypothetical protein
VIVAVASGKGGNWQEHCGRHQSAAGHREKARSVARYGNWRSWRLDCGKVPTNKTV